MRGSPRSRLALALLVGATYGASPVPDPRAPVAPDDAHAELGRARREQALIRAETTAELLALLELAPILDETR